MHTRVSLGSRWQEIATGLGTASGAFRVCRAGPTRRRIRPLFYTDLGSPLFLVGAAGQLAQHYRQRVSSLSQ